MENKKPAIFLDRDGCVTVEKSYVKTAEDMEIYLCKEMRGQNT